MVFLRFVMLSHFSSTYLIGIVYGVTFLSSVSLSVTRQRWQLLDSAYFSSIAVLAGCIIVPLLWWVYRTRISLRQHKMLLATILVAIVGSITTSLMSWRALNALLDTSHPQQCNTRVMDLSSNRYGGRRRNFSVKLLACDAFSRTILLRIHPDLYQQLALNDDVRLFYRSGALGSPWATNDPIQKR